MERTMTEKLIFISLNTFVGGIFGIIAQQGASEILGWFLPQSAGTLILSCLMGLYVFGKFWE